MASFVPPATGVRVVRALARDEHVETLLVQLDGEDGQAPAALLRALDEAGAVRRRRELVALDRGRGPGVVEVLDVVDDAPTPAVLLRHLPGPRLGEVLARRERWEAGEAVTLLTGVADTVARLHDVGVALGVGGLGGVVLAASGPVVTELPAPGLFAAEAPEVVRAGVPEVGDDREALRGLALELLGRVSGARAAAALELATRIAGTAPDALLPALRHGLGELAAGTAVRPVDPEPERGPLADASPAPVHGVADEVGGPAGAGRWLELAGAGELRGRVEEVTARIRTLLDGMPALRRRLVLGGGAAVAAGAVLLALVPGPAEPAEGSAVEAATGTQAPVEPAGAPDGPTVSDDPLEALTALLGLREACFRELSLLCLEQVDQPGSAALAADRAAVQALRDGGESTAPAADPRGARIVERLGDSVLVEIGPETAPASLLLMRGEAGWRIRDWIAAGPSAD
ncbi:hypothetical protein [Protaetiibacter intestinalis]|uniref:Protein kinase domain-containing protein n=1 Tax=Protaetiibacter intestinalis TaxID=2419774 RepID=A0A387BE53_9MICO|nr:hypothetical protein [Protaetiibacter intestinalis]AYF99179.1 hypothetical protein D7I47_13555 [Protaetiibacter intestinalis]